MNPYSAVGVYTTRFMKIKTLSITFSKMDVSVLFVLHRREMIILSLSYKDMRVDIFVALFKIYSASSCLCKETSSLTVPNEGDGAEDDVGRDDAG